MIEKELEAKGDAMQSKLKQLAKEGLGSMGVTEEDSGSDFESESYGSDHDINDGYDSGEDGHDRDTIHRSKTKRDKRRKRLKAAAQAEWAKMPTTWDQVDLESDKKFFNLVEGEAEENRINQKTEAE